MAHLMAQVIFYLWSINENDACILEDTIGHQHTLVEMPPYLKEKRNALGHRMATLS